jgi:hypothetical protein
MSAYREWEVTTWGTVDLGLDEQALAPHLAPRSEGFPPPLEVGERFSGHPADVAQDVVTALRLLKLVG